MSKAADIVRKYTHVLLDFDGPICAVFGALSDQAVADRLRTLLPGALPAAVAATNDPFEVLRYAEARSLEVQARVEGELTRLEVTAIADAPDTPDAAQVIRRLHESGQTVTIVSNNSASAVNAYLQSRVLSDYVAGISAREQVRPLMLKPHPHLLQVAMTNLDSDPSECIMIGDSVSDIHAAYRAHTAVVVLANKIGKRDRFEPHHPSAIVDHMSQLID